MSTADPLSQQPSTFRNTLGVLPVMALSAVITDPAMAQSTTPPQAGVTTNADGDVALDQVNVEGGEGGADTANVNDDTTQIGRLPGRVQDQPQVVNVIPREVIDQQQATTLDEVLRNVPGVTLQIGEGGGGFNGSNFKIRGFNAQNDVYVDGLRDFGTYTRDSFNMESVQVFKGGSSETFGMGTTGGAINSQSKTARLENFIDVSGSLGTGPLARGTIDINRQLSETTAIRINGMIHNQDVADRDGVEADRWGVAASLGLGIGTDLEYTLSFFHQKDNRVPDYGIPTFAAGTYNGTVIDITQPGTEFGLDRSNWYGLETDADESQVDMLTGRLKYEATDWLTLYNDTRFSYYDRYFTPIPVSCSNSGTSTCVTDFFTDPASATASRGGPGPYSLEGWALQNVSTAVAKFDTGQFRHEFVGGLDMHTQRSDRYAWSYTPVNSKPSTSLIDPDPAFGSVAEKTGAWVENEASNIGIFASDRFWLTEQLSVLGGVRWDWYSVDADSVATNGTHTLSSSDSVLFNPKASLIWEPTPDQTYYVSWLRSATPQGIAVSNSTSSTGAAGNDALDPEESETYEAGAKLNLFDGRLGLSGAIFQTTKDNAVEIDNGILVSNSGQRQRMRGLELGLTGQVTDALTVSAAYTYIDSEILMAYSNNGSNANPDYVPNYNEIGNEVVFVPKHAFSAWLTYDASKLIEDSIDGKLLVGTGVTYSSKVWLNAANSAMAPENFSWDAMASYEKDNFRVALNVRNITNRLNYDQVHSNRVVPSSGRTFTLTAGAKF